MKLFMITADVVALGVLIGAAAQIIPAVAGLLAIAYYGFLVYDRIRYGPDIFRINKHDANNNKT